MKFCIKSFITGVITAGVSIIAVATIFAVGGIKSASFNDNKLVFDGKVLDLSNIPMVSVVKEGETDSIDYIPKEILEEMGFTVDWDEKTKTVLVNTLSQPDVYEMIAGYWICERDHMIMKYYFDNDGHFVWLTDENDEVEVLWGDYNVDSNSRLVLEYKLDNGNKAEIDIEINFAEDGKSWSCGNFGSELTFQIDTGERSWTEEGATVVSRSNMPNPWDICTEDNAFKYLGAQFKIKPPSGYKLVEVAVLAEPYAEAQGEAARFAYTNKQDEMYRVHILAGAAKELINNGEYIETNGIDVYYNENENAVSYAQDDYMITIDMLDKSKDELLKTVGSVMLIQN